MCVCVCLKIDTLFGLAHILTNRYFSENISYSTVICQPPEM